MPMGCDHLESENHFYNNTTISFYGNSLALYIYHYHVRGSIEESKRSNDVNHRFSDFDVLTSFRDRLPCRFFFAFPWSNSKRTTFTMTIYTFFVLFVVLGNKSASTSPKRGKYIAHYSRGFKKSIFGCTKLSSFKTLSNDERQNAPAPF